MRPRLPTTQHPASQKTRRGPTPQPSPPPAPINHSIRKEREGLLKRGAKALSSNTQTANGLPTPSHSPRSGKTGAFDKPGRVLRGKEGECLTEIKTDTRYAGYAEGKTEAGTEKEGEGRDSAEDPEHEVDGWSEEFADSDDDELSKEANKARKRRAKLTCRHIDVVKDDIPYGLEIPISIENILIYPTAKIEMEEICIAFEFLKAQIQDYCRMCYKHRNFNNDQIFPTFTQLKVKHPELFRYIQYVADGSQYSWDKLLSLAPQRELLVYGIISRALIAHMFDAELFGASPEDEETLLEMCRTYLNYDAFVRNTHRTEIILPILLKQAQQHAAPTDDPYSYFTPALESLRDRITALLQPLHKREKSDLDQASMFWIHRDSINKILQTALKIHLAIRLAGSNGTVYRFEHTPKFSHWDSTTMNCVNQLHTDLTVHHGDSPLVKMSCFPAVFATVPSGPNLQQFSNPAFVANWQETAGADGSKPLITTYPITLSDVALENTPTDRSGFVTLNQTMAREQSRMSDADLLKLTGINRPRIRRLNRIGKVTRKYASRAAQIALAAATIGWSVYKHRDALALALRQVSQRLRDPELSLRSVLRTVRATREVTRRSTVAAKVTKTVVGMVGRRTATSPLTIKEGRTTGV